MFALFISVASLLALLEFYRMTMPDRPAESALAAAFGAVLTLAPLHHCGTINTVQAGLSLVTLLMGLFFLFRIDDIKTAGKNFTAATAGFLYIPLLLSHLVLLRYESHGTKWIFLLLVIVMSGDTAAYYVGSSIGKRKLYPLVSPNKSKEGAVGGILGSMVGAQLARITFFPELSIGDAIATPLLLGIMGQVGDLFESMLKRTFGVKDSGTIIPGHGGILDRLDSIIFAAPVAYYYAKLFSGA